MKFARPAVHPDARPPGPVARPGDNTTAVEADRDAQAEVLRGQPHGGGCHEPPGPADRVHEPRRGSSILGPDHVEQRSEDVGVVNSLAQSRAHERSDQHGDGSDHPGQKHKRRPEPGPGSEP